MDGESPNLQITTPNAGNIANTDSPDSSSTPRVATSSASRASISIVAVTKDTVQFEFQDGIVHETLGMTRLRAPVRARALVSALHAASRFFRYLGSSPLPPSTAFCSSRTLVGSTRLSDRCGQCCT